MLLGLLDALEQDRLSNSDMEEILETVIAYLFRRSLCSVPANALNKIFVSLILTLKKMPLDYKELLKFTLLNKKDSGRFPTDEELRQSLGAKDIYSMNMKNKGYLFEKLEHYQNNERVDTQGGLNQRKLQIEHIMPQKLSSEWRRDLGEDHKRIHDSYLHTLANLTLTGYNQKMGNLSFQKKQENGFNKSPLYLNQYLSRAQVFNETTLQERFKQLSKRCIAIWKYPETTYKALKHSKQDNTYTLVDEDIDFTFKKLLSFRLDNNIEKSTNKWVVFYVEAIDYLLDQDLTYFQRFQAELGKRILSASEKSLVEPKKLRNGMFVRGHGDTQGKLRNLRRMVELTDFDLDDFEFTVEGAKEEPKTTYKAPRHSRQDSTYTLADEDIDFTFKKLLSFRLDSNIEKSTSNWITFYIEAIRYLLNYDLAYFQKFQSTLTGRILSTSGKSLLNPKKLREGVYLEGVSSTEQKLNNLRRMVELTDFDLDDFEFTVEGAEEDA